MEKFRGQIQFLPFLAGIPGIGWILTLVLGAVAVAVATGVLGIVKFDLSSILLIGAGVFLAFKVLGSLIPKLDESQLFFLAIVAMAAVFFGLYNLNVFSGLGLRAYSISP